MAVPLDVDKEQVRLLVLEWGVREAARMCGLSENTVLAWSNRFGWIKSLQQAPKLPASMQPVRPIGAISPVEALTKALREAVSKSRSNVSRWAVSASEEAASNGELAQAQDVKHLASVLDSLDPDKGKDTGVSLSLFQVAGDMVLDQRSVTVTPDIEA